MTKDRDSIRASLLVMLMLCSTLVNFLEPAPEEPREEFEHSLESSFTGSTNATFGPSTISFGSTTKCLIYSDGTPKCQGSNVGDGTENYSFTLTDVSIPSVRKAKSISTEYGSACVVLDNGSVMCWGTNYEAGQLGVGDSINRTSPTYVVLPNGVEAEHVDISRYSSCILLTNGSMMCAGRYWALGNAASNHSNIPQYVSLPTGRTVTQFSTGYWISCAILDNSSAMCWGTASPIGLGNGNNSGNYGLPSYVQTPNGQGIKSISVGYEHVCMILTDSSVYCWGKNDYGQLGNGGNTTSYSAVAVSVPTNVSALHISSGYYHTCAVFDDGKTRCWGKASNGALGDGQTYSYNDYVTSPVNVSMPSGTNILNLTSGYADSCVLTSNLSALCWGWGSTTPVYSFSSSNGQIAKPGDLIFKPPANGSISASLEFDFINMRLKGDWQASNLVTGHDYNVSWSLKYQNNGTVISNGWPDSFYATSLNQSNAAVRSWSSGFLYGETICYEITLRDGDGFTGTALDNSTSCITTPIQLTGLSPNDVLGAVERSSPGNCAASSESSVQSSSRICDNNTGTEWVSGSDTDNAEEEITIDFDLGSTPVKVDAVAAYVNNADYLSTIKDVRLQFLDEAGVYQTIGIFQIQQAAGWQFFGGFSVMTTEIRWDVITNYGYSHTVLFEGKILDIPDKIFNSTADWNSINSENSHSVALGDVDGDGDLDLAVANTLQYNRLYLNDGNTLSTSPVWTSSNSLNSRDMAWGDVDGDGDLDLAVANHNGKNEIYFNSGTGLATTPGWQSSNSWSSVSVSWGDIDGDGDLDLAVGNQAHQNEVYLNDGSTLGTNSYWTSSNSLNTNSAIWGDVDGDGDLDLAVGSYDTNNEVYLNDGSTLENTPSWTSSNSQYTLMLAWGDIDGDGDLDLAVGNRHQSNEIYLNTGTSLSTTPSFVTTETTSTNWISLGDLDGDGTLDMIAGNREHASTNSSSSNQVYFNSGSILQSSAAWTGNARETYGTALGDVDGDGDLDLVVANKNSESNELFFNQLDNGGAGADGLPDIDIGGPGDSEFSGKNLATGYEHNCAIQKNQTLRCWGGNWNGQLGNQQYQQQSYSTPLYDVELPQGTIPIDVSVAEGYSCVIVRNISNEAYCWGRGASGKLGDGDSSDSHKPEDKVLLPAGVNPIAISSGRAHSCLVSDDGDIYCWGEDGRGQLGDGNSGGFSSTPSLVQGVDADFVSLAVGNEHSCAITSEGALYCWGGNWDGQLGDGSWYDSASPVEVSSQESWKHVESSGNAHHSCAISSSDELWCWGQNYVGQLGDGTTSNANSPRLVQQLSDTLKVTETSVGSYGTSCAVLEDSSTYCWGMNARGYLGDGTWQSSLIPSRVLLPKGSEVVEISSGHEHSCVLLANDQIMCWGYGNAGVIGNGDHSDVGYPHYVSGDHEWNGLGKDFYHLSPSMGIGGSEPKLSVEMSLSSIPTGLSVDISQRIFFFYQNGIMISSSLEDIDIQSLNGSVWTNEFSFHDEIPSISGNNNRYCIEYYLNSNVTGDSIGYGIDCEWYNPPNSGDDFAPDEFEDIWGTSTDSHDTDDDGYEDWFEYWFGGDPTDATITPDDIDMDGLPDNLELALNSNRSNTDTDGDGHQDLDEFLYGGHLLKIWESPPNWDYDDCYDYWEAWQGLNNSNSDTDGDGVIDCFDTDGLDPDNTPLDTDGDGMPDLLEEEFGTNSSYWDSDGDGMPDSFEYILGTNPLDANSYSSDWVLDWSNQLTGGQNVSISASSSKQNHSASLAIDYSTTVNEQNLGTYWQSDGPCPATLEIDLGRAQYFSHLEFQIKVLEPGNHPLNYSIEYRESNSDSWTNYETWNRYGQEHFTDIWEGVGTKLPMSKARYVRLNCSDSTDNSGISHEIAISVFRIWGVKNTQFINPHGIPDVDSGDPQVEAFLNVDSANETLTAGYSAQLNQGLDYDIEWRLIEAEQGSCSDISLSIDQGTVNINNWDIADNNTFQQFPVNYSSISNWYTEFCLQLELLQAGNSLDVDWLFIDNTGSANNGSNGTNNTLLDTDGDGVSDLIDSCPGTSANVQVDLVGCPIDEPSTNVTHNTTLEADFIEQQIDGVWNQKIELIILDPWKGYNHSLSVKISDPNGNTVFSYFSPVDEDDSQSGWWILFTDSYVDNIEWTLNLNWDGNLESGYWKSSTRFFEENEYPYFESGEYCLEVSLGYQMNSSDSSMSSVNNIVDSALICGTFAHDSMEGVIWDGTVENEKGLIDRLSSNAIVSKVLDFMDSTTGQIISILLGILAFAGRMVLARGQRSKNKRVRKFSERIRKAETVGRLKIIEQDVEKANDKNKLPRGGYGDLMEQIEAQMEKLGFDENPQDGQTSGDWSSDDGTNEWQDDFQQAADMMWDAQDMMAEAREEAAMARQAIEDMQDQMGHMPQRTRTQEPEPEEAFSSKYVTSGIDSSAAGASGPSLPSSRIMDLDGDGVVSQEEKEIWNAMSQEERAEFFSPITNIAEEIRRRQIINEKREKMNKKRGGKKDKKRKKKDKRW